MKGGYKSFQSLPLSKLKKKVRKGDFRDLAAKAGSSRPINKEDGCNYCGHYHTLLQCLMPVNGSKSAALPFYRDSLWEVLDSNERASEWVERKREPLTIEN